MTPATLAQAIGCPVARAEIWAMPLTCAMAEYGIDTKARQAAFLAQVAHESGRLLFTRELWGPTLAQRKYEGRADLGNNEPGDGYRFRGRGLIQITGRANYAQVSRALGVDFVQSPEKLEIPTWAAKSAAWYWDSRQLNRFADTETPEGFVALTQAINGGTTGITDRRELWAMAQHALAVA